MKTIRVGREPSRSGGRGPLGALVAAALVLSSLVAIGGGAPARAITIDWVTVGDAGNAADDTTYGAVAAAYRIGKYEVTIQQYTDFLNAVAQTDTYSLYSTLMVSPASAGISRSGVSGSYTYSVTGPAGATPAGASSPGNRPVTFVSWWDAARFANWMHNGQGSGSTETGAYTLGGATSGTLPTVNPGAQFFLPSEDQWYKAAYYKGSGTNAGYWDYATQSDTVPGNVIGSGTNQANYNNGNVYSVTQSGITSGQNYLTDVGAFTNSPSGYGTFDQTGNVDEWLDRTGGTGSSNGVVRGGTWAAWAQNLPSTFRLTPPATVEDSALGFRLAGVVSSPSGVPEIDPSGVPFVTALLVGGLALLERRRLAR
jgi:sulfatase modifying factor 1